VALALIKPLDGEQPFELTAEGTCVWHPVWRGQVDDDINARFIKEVAERAYNNEKVSSNICWRAKFEVGAHL